MPVVRTDISRLKRLVGASSEVIIDRIPYVGLDIESVEGDEVRVEYSPNRPDFGTDFGIARALRGILGKEVGLPEFKTHRSGITVSVDPRLSKVRPYIACATATGLNMDEEDVRQIISLQEDLHNGLGRKRKVVAIGLHDLSAIEPPISYHGVASDFRFVPLGSSTEKSIRRVLEDTQEGRAYGPALGDSGLYPVITDRMSTLLSFPPVINGDRTRVTPKTKGLFIDVTSTDQRAGDEVLAVLVTTLAAAGAKLGTVKVAYRRASRTTPDLSPVSLPLDYDLIGSVTGLVMSKVEVRRCLARSRMAVRGAKAVAPRYRIDLLHPVDVAEEVALGYGIDKIKDLYPPSNAPGNFEPFEVFLDSVSTTMAGAGMVELMTYELTDEKTLYANFGRPSDGRISVHDPKSVDHSILRDSLIPGLMAALSGNIKSDYPQRVFEIGRVYSKDASGVHEGWRLGCLVAHSLAGYTEAKSHLQAACRVLAGREPSTTSGGHWAFAEGRSAAVSLVGVNAGWVGELAPECLDAFGLRVPVAGFEVDLELVAKSLK